jgi:serine/threonine protein kinase
MAPEILGYLDTLNDEYTNAIDLWAAGCITYRLVAGTVPFPPGVSLLKYCEDKSLFPYNALLDNGIKGLCTEFIKELLEFHPKQRPSASQALKHTWIVVG